MNLNKYYTDLKEKATNPKHKAYANFMLEKISGKEVRYDEKLFMERYYCEHNNKFYKYIFEIAQDLNLDKRMVHLILHGKRPNHYGLRKLD